MIDPDFPDDDPLEAGLRAAFGPESTSDPRGGSVLTALRDSSGPPPNVRLRDEPDEGPTGAVGLHPPELAGAGPGVVNGRYEVSGEVARGGIGVVLRGRDRDLGREVALKVLRLEHLDNPSMVRRLVEEAQIGGQLQHPGILPVYELGLDSAWRPFFAMKLVRGRTLAALLDDRGKLPRDHRRFLAIFEQVAQTIAYAHARGVIHRDLKPSNVMVGAFGEVQVVDWGLAKVLDRGSGPDPVGDGSPSGSGSEAGSVLGTPAYMAPEQARGESQTLDERADVFALGAILCEILTGRPAYRGTRDEVLRQSRAGSLDDAFARLGACRADPELVGIARHCLDPAPEARPREAGQVARAITAHLASAEERARSAEREAAAAVAVAGSERRARRLTVALAGLLLAVLVIVVVGSSWVIREQARASDALLLAGREALRVEREHTARIEGALEVLFATEQKGQMLILQAADAAGRDAARWADLLAACRSIAERVAASTPDEAARRRARDLAGRLRVKEVVLRQKAESSRNDERKPGEP